MKIIHTFFLASLLCISGAYTMDMDNECENKCTTSHKNDCANLPFSLLVTRTENYISSLVRYHHCLQKCSIKPAQAAPKATLSSTSTQQADIPSYPMPISDR